MSDPVNVRYLTGFESSNVVLLVGRQRVTLVTDYRYAEAARSLDDFEVVEGERVLPAWLGPRLGDFGKGPLAFEADALTVSAHAGLSADGVELVPTERVVVELRAVKEPGELDAIRRAAELAHTAYEALHDHGLVGHTEREVAWFLERTMRDAGAEGASFDPIIGSGANGAVPHHHPGERRVEPNELVVVDAGAKLDGYCSDCTRTFATGALPDDLARAYEVCLEAQVRALDAVHAGVSTRSVHELAHGVIEAAGQPHLQHGVGHGVGLDIHEAPVLRKDSEGDLVAGNVVTIEPGIYLAGRGGVRIEDLVIVTDEGADVLTPFTKDLLTLD